MRALSDTMVKNIIQLTELIDKYILIGITYKDNEENITSYEQLHGVVDTADETDIIIKLKGSNEGKTWSMPPDTSCISIAEPGIYNLKSTGESVENPDLLCTWTIHAP